MSLPQHIIPLLDGPPRFRLEELVNPADRLLPRNTGVLTTPEIDGWLARHAPVALGVSGGKDGNAAAFATVQHLDQIGHTGPRLLIHADLGRVEHTQSLPMCELLAERLGLELVVVRRQKGDMMDRWLQRWRDNVARYVNLECVQLILPWSTPAMRYCTQELKVAVQTRFLVQHWPGQIILSVSGIRREESSKRAKAPIQGEQPKLTSKTFGTTGADWHPILHWTLADVLALHEREQFPLHDHYTVWNASRVSCAYCIMSSWLDLVAASQNPENHDIYREMVDLEIVSAFGFQERTWLGDVAPHLLSADQCAGVAEAKQKAAKRDAIEARIPKHLLYDRQGWPTCIPTYDEAVVLGEVRAEVSQLMTLPVLYIAPHAIIDRFGELYEEKQRRDAKNARKNHPARAPKEALLCSL